MRHPAKIAILLAVAAVASVALSAPTTGRLRGSVVDEAGQPVGGLTLRFVPADESGNATRTLAVSKKGRFSHSFFPTGDYRVELQEPGRFIKSMTYVLLDASGIELTRETGQAHPVKGVAPFNLGLGQSVELELVLATEERRAALAQQVAIAEASGPLKEMKALYDDGNMQGVVERGKHVIGEHPDLGVAHYLLGMAQARLGEDDEALASLRRALDLVPDQQGVAGALGTALLQKGRALAAAGEPDRAKETFRAAAETLEQELDRFGPSEIYLANRVAALEADGDREEFGAALEKLVQVAPTNQGAWLRLVAFQAERGRFDAALESLGQAPRSDPKDLSLAAYNLAAGAFNAGDADSAVAAAELGLAADPELPVLYRVLGRAQVARGERSAAIETLSKFLELAPDDPEAGAERKLLEELKRSGS